MAKEFPDFLVHTVDHNTDLAVGGLQEALACLSFPRHTTD